MQRNSATITTTGWACARQLLCGAFTAALVLAGTGIALAQSTLPAGFAAQIPAATAASERFAAVGDKTIKDRQTGLLWTQRENGFAIDWYQARDYCAKMDGGWRLPRAEDFAGIQADLSRVTKPCADATCKSETPFRLANGWLWSDTSNGVSEAIGVNLVTGEQQPTYRAKRHRAICVSGT